MTIALVGILDLTIALAGVADGFIPVVSGVTGSPMGLLLIWTYA